MTSSAAELADFAVREAAEAFVGVVASSSVLGGARPEHDRTSLEAWVVWRSGLVDDGQVVRAQIH